MSSETFAQILFHLHSYEILQLETPITLSTYFFSQLILSFSLICVWLVVLYLMFRMCAFNITSCIKFCLHLHHVLQATQTFNVKTKMNNHLHHQTNRQDIQYHYFKSQIVEYLPAFQIILFRHHSPSDEPGLRVTHTMNLVSKP